MGAWGRGPFDNDDAADWVGELQDSGLAAVEAALNPSDDPSAERLGLDNAHLLQAEAGARAVAAAEVVAALRGAPGPDLSDEVEAWLAAEDRHVTDELVVAAKAAVLRVTDDGSELAELWDETVESAAWRATLADLHRRLSDVP